MHDLVNQSTMRMLRLGPNISHPLGSVDPSGFAEPKILRSSLYSRRLAPSQLPNLLQSGHRSIAWVSSHERPVSPAQEKRVLQFRPRQ